MTENNNSGSYVFTDTFKTKDLIWDAYEGYVSHFNNYMMYEHLNKNNPIIKSGLDRYAHNFYYEIEEFLNEFVKRLEQKNIDKLDALFNESKDFKKEDYVFMRRFFNKFMVVSGIKAIVKQKDTMSEFARSQSNG